MVIKFLPHWDYYKIDGIALLLPDSENDIWAAIRCVKKLKFDGYDPVDVG